MILSRQIYTTGLIPIGVNTNTTTVIKTSQQDFVCMALGTSTTFSYGNLTFFDLIFGNSNDRYSNKPISAWFYNNNNNFFSSDKAYTRANAKPLFLVKGGEQIQVNFYNLDLNNADFVSLSLIGYFIDNYGRTLIDIPNTPTQITSKL